MKFRTGCIVREDARRILSLSKSLIIILIMISVYFGNSLIVLIAYSEQLASLRHCSGVHFLQICSVDIIRPHKPAEHKHPLLKRIQIIEIEISINYSII